LLQAASLPFRAVSSNSRSSLVARRGPNVVSERFSSETLVLDPDSDRYVRLNQTGSRLWELLEQPVRSEALAEVLVQEWELDRERAYGDVVAFLTSLADRGLVEFTQP
jgi:hypothetical protein